MKLGIHDRDALLAVSSAALSAYARVAGWRRQEPYRVHSDVYEGTGLPEIIIPRTEHLGDYASVVATLIETFADLCEALATLTEALPALDISVVWARTWPRDEARTATRFAAHDAPVLREAGRAFRNREPQPGVVLVGLVQRLTRDETDTDGTVTLRTSIDGSNQSVVTVLPQSDYHRAIEAHKTKAPVVMRGDLERAGQRWRLLNPSIEDVIVNDETPSDANRRFSS